MSSFKKNMIWLASYPKSGNTWVRIFLQQIIGMNQGNEGIPALFEIPIASSRVLLDTYLGVHSSDLTQEEIMDYRPLIYGSISKQVKGIQVLKVHDLFGTTSEGNLLFPKEVTKYAIYVVRNPLDVAVSYSKHSGKTIQAIINQMNDPSFKISINENELKAQVSQHLGTWSDHVISWTEQLEVPVLLIKYEELLDDARAIFSELLNRLEISYREEDFDKALKEVEFDRLKELEQSYGFREKPLQAASFFREGKKDTYKDYLNSTQTKELMNNHQVIMTKLGYLKKQE